MKSRKSNSEHGQAMVLLVLVIIGLMGALAVAVDGGMIMYDRRSAQNAADAGALAGGYELANNPWDTTTLSARIQTAGLTRAADNGYSSPDKTVVVEYPPVAGTFHYAGTDTNVNHYIRVKITSPVDTSFIHFVYSGQVQNQVESVVHVIPPTHGPMYPGSGLVALAPTACNMLYAGGNVVANLIGGGIFVNSNSPSCAMTIQGGANQLYSPTVTVVGGISNSGGLTVQPGPMSSPSPTSALPFPPDGAPTAPTCSTAATLTTKIQTIDGTTYDREMTPGSYGALPNKDVWLNRESTAFPPDLIWPTINILVVRK